MDTTTARAAGPARWIVVLAVLVGLFLMHGGPGSAMGGCHGAMPLAMPAPVHQLTAPIAQTHNTVQVRQGTAAGMGAAGALCVSTPARDHLPLLPTTLAALAVLILLGGITGSSGREAAFGTRWRGPPTAGRQILLRVCIART
ncbi:hypothetical protein ABIA33_002313 [Streptacidiphilus sp. MAP12-16]|uniref:hypothetical protein n=1 Tax=Streptacidiphilus sp. MAP12-16 TaxID=3156300 RepID=UPI003510F16E